jgi:hypothetical protein
MKRFLTVSLMIAAVVVIGSSLVLAAGPKTYQVTGPVLEIKDDMIIVQKGKEKWEIAKDAATKVTGDLKVGAKVTIEYTMKATAVDVKEAGKKAETKAVAPATSTPKAPAKK